MNESLLYPITNETRTALSLDGLWNFQFDPKQVGNAQSWEQGLPNPVSMPVPSSFSDLFTTKEERDYCGDFWYEKTFYIPSDWNGEIFLRFGSITHRGSVYCNGTFITEHEGGFLPVIAHITDAAIPGKPNRVTVKVNNELNESTLPCGTVAVMKNGRKISKPYFDFFNYSGLQRSVYLIQLPSESILDYDLSYELKGADALIHYEVQTSGEHPVEVALLDADGRTVASENGKQGTLYVSNAHLWQVRNAYLYRLAISITDTEGERLLDQYSEKIGIRTIEIQGTQILVNGNAVYLKGFGKHEDFDVFGRGFHWAIAKRDFECMKWTNANCFRTSHYPYAEEWYQFADEEGFLIIDEVPAVGMMRSTHNFAAAGTGQYTYFFETPTVPQLKKNHLQQVEEMIQRDKNHPSVIAWSLFNEPETTSTFAYEYFSDIFQAARQLDPQKRPLTGALEKNSSPEKCKCYGLCDFICLNRYYGWYISGGPEIEEAEEKFFDEMNRWAEKKLDVPFVFTEFGTDTLATEHKLPGIMWSQEYQKEYMERNFRVFDHFDFIQGELVWNFADFQTSEGIMRVNGNKKGIFTRQRQPKDSAFLLKERWSQR